MFCDYRPLKLGAFVCINCGERTSKRMHYETPPLRNCPVYGPEPKPDPVAWFTARHAKIAAKKECPPLSDALTRLDKCLSSGCPKLVNGTCTDYYGSKCKMTLAWFTRLLWGDCERMSDITGEPE